VQTYPILGNRSVDTVLTAHSGQPIIFGGLTQDNESHTTQKIPLLGDIPLFGALFRNVQTTNLQEQIVFTITPIVEKQ
jgi:type II secretory pathway component GspD/PulD (secretin)